MRRPDDRGSATIYALTAVAMLAAVAMAVLGFAGLVAAKHRAGAAADLAALAGAAAVSNGTDPCAAAADIALRNDAALVGCFVNGAVVDVRVQTRGPTLLGLSPTLQASARAGPSTLPGS